MIEHLFVWAVASANLERTKRIQHRPPFDTSRAGRPEASLDAEDRLGRLILDIRPVAPTTARMIQGMADVR